MSEVSVERLMSAARRFCVPPGSSEARSQPRLGRPHVYGGRLMATDRVKLLSVASTNLPAGAAGELLENGDVSPLALGEGWPIAAAEEVMRRVANYPVMMVALVEDELALGLDVDCAPAPRACDHCDETGLEPCECRCGNKHRGVEACRACSGARRLTARPAAVFLERDFPHFRPRDCKVDIKDDARLSVACLSTSAVEACVAGLRDLGVSRVLIRASARWDPVALEFAGGVMCVMPIV